LSFASLFALTAGEQPTWISLGLDYERLKRSILFSLMAAKVSEPFSTLRGKTGCLEIGINHNREEWFVFLRFFRLMA
jgi:hypothetical protein